MVGQTRHELAVGHGSGVMEDRVLVSMNMTIKSIVGAGLVANDDD